MILIDLPNNDLAEVCALQKIFPRDRDSMDATASTFYKRTPVHTCVSLIHTPSTVHSLHLYPPVTAPHHTLIKNLHHHQITHQQKHHTTTHPIRYQMYHLTQIQIQICQTHLFWNNMIHQRTVILNKDDTQIIIIRTSRVEHISMTQSKSAQSLQLSYLKLRTTRRPPSSNWMRIHYIYGFIYYLS